MRQNHLTIPVLMQFFDRLTGSISALLNASSLACLMFLPSCLNEDPSNRVPTLPTILLPETSMTLDILLGEHTILFI